MASGVTSCTLAAQFAIHAADEVVDQQWQIVDAVAQGRYVQREHVQPIVEVLAKTAGGDQRLQVLVGGGDDANARGDGGVSAEALELPFLKKPQELGLRCRRHVADFVEEQRAAIGLLKLADTPAVGAGEVPRSWPKSSLSSSDSGMAAQLIARNGAWLRRLC